MNVRQKADGTYAVRVTRRVTSSTKLFMSGPGTSSAGETKTYTSTSRPRSAEAAWREACRHEWAAQREAQRGARTADAIARQAVASVQTAHAAMLSAIRDQDDTAVADAHRAESMAALQTTLAETAALTQAAPNHPLIPELTRLTESLIAMNQNDATAQRAKAATQAAIDEHLAMLNAAQSRDMAAADTHRVEAMAALQTALAETAALIEADPDYPAIPKLIKINKSLIAELEDFAKIRPAILSSQE
jgi:hypothetical protein